MILYFLSLALFVMGLYCLVAKKNIIKKVIGIVITEYSINMFLILVGYRDGGIAPVLMKGMDNSEIAAGSVDPLPQALVLTSIVIGLGVLALMVSICLRLYEKYKTFDMSEIKRLRG
ncbi:MAG: cation:proton antiporter [Candidatus Latescibacteria bacterium]|jgi:multicomponent Na+:H+ antiporter subunit C|nr:cation:proton antiporter [bacterium]MBD3423526.1 cation:proton antiporter [Candidatus Latescibacterota bacterium]